MANHSHPASAATLTGALPARAGLLFVRLLHEESGQDIIEYALISALVGLASVAGIHGIAAQISNDLTLILNGFQHALGQ